MPERESRDEQKNVGLASINSPHMHKTLAFILILFHCFISRGQDQVLLMNGQLIECHITSDTSLVLQFDQQKKNGKIKSREIHKSDVFSYTLAGKPETILYAKDEMLGDIYSIDEMRMYMAGGRDARENYSALPTAAVGFVVCGTAAYLGGDGLLTALLPPIAYTCLQFIPRIKIREETMSDPGYKYNDIYADGYEPPARSRKVQGALRGGFAGAISGVLLFYALN
jgi:hypothetical protein